jgi:hypothetical protein
LLTQVECWREAPRLSFIGEAPGYWEALRTLLERGRAQGTRAHDARIAALCLQHGVTQLWSADRDFGRLPSLTVVNPLARTRSRISGTAPRVRYTSATDSDPTADTRWPSPF